MHPLLLPLMLAGPKAGVVETVSLSGTQGSPVFRSYLGLQPDTAVLVYTIAASDSVLNSIGKGNVEWAGYDEGDLATFTGISTATTWVNVKEFTGTYWVRFTLDSGDTCNAAATATFGVWHSLTVGNRFFGWQNDGIQPYGGVVKVEIADNTPQDSNIVATGYYQGNVLADL